MTSQRFTSLLSASWPRQETPRRRPSLVSGTKTAAAWRGTTRLPCPGSDERLNKGMPQGRPPLASCTTLAAASHKTTKSPSSGTVLPLHKETLVVSITSADVPGRSWGGANDREAVRWYRRSAEQGFPHGQNNLGWMYATGRGVQTDEAEAVRWYRRSAEQGHARGQNNLGWMYERGRGVRRDRVEAIRWYRLAAAQGDQLAQENLRRLR